MPGKIDHQMFFTPIGTIHSCYGEKFGIPRQPGLVKCATATLELLPPYNTPDALRGLEDFSHVWIIFMLHQSSREDWKATVRPPRLGGNKRIGVFASRSNFRPNPIGLSVVELLGIHETTLKLGGGDFLNGTPVLDIKPYIPYADRIPAATGAFADHPPQPIYQVMFSPEAEQSTLALEDSTRPALRQLICDMLAYNPRPAYQPADSERVYGTRIFDLEIQWRQMNAAIHILSIEKA